MANRPDEDWEAPDDAGAGDPQPDPDAGVLDAHQEPETVRIRVDGTVRPFTLHEMSGPQLAGWLAVISQRARTRRKGQKAKTDFEGFHADLICRCLRDADGRPVPRETVQGWGTNLKNDLFVRCRRINGLDKDTEEAEGKA